MYHHQQSIDTKKAVGITSKRKPVNRTPEEKKSLMLKSMNTKATNKLIKEEMEKIKSLPAYEQLNKIDEYKPKYNISSDQLKSQSGYDNHTTGKDKKRKI